LKVNPLAVSSGRREALSFVLSARMSSAAWFRCLATMGRAFSGMRSQTFWLVMHHQPSHMWLVIEQYFCTS
jgi:hypothetical protein